MATQGNDTGGAVYLRVGLDASGVSEGVTDIKQELNTIPAAAQQAAQGANKSLATLGVPADATANIERFKDAFGGIARATKEELGESARFTNSYVSQIKRTAADVDAVTQAMVNKARTLQSADPRLQNETVNQAIAGLQKLASQNEVVTAAVKQQAAAQQVANKATQEAAAQFANFERSAQSARLELLSFGKTASEKYQIRAELLGIDKTQAVQKIVADLKSAEAAALAAGKGVGQSITPALQGAALQGKALNAALRQVPAQFTDIVVSLQGGQAPLTVLLQQGGQLKDVFGGVGAATEALGKYVLGLVNPFTVAAAAVGTFGIAFYQGRKESEEFNKALILTGNQSGLTVTKLNDIAASMDNVAGVTKGSAAQALLAFTNSTGVASGSFERFAAIAIRMQNATGLAVAETVTQFAALAKDPVSASLKLNETTNFLTVSIYKQIKALEDQGKTSEAAALAQNAYATAMEQRLPRLEENLGTLEKAWKVIANGAKEAWDAMLNVGRTANPLDAARGALASAEQALERARETANTGGLRGGEQANADARVQRLERTLKLRQDEVMLLGKGAGYEALSAQYQQQNAARTAAQAVFDKDHEKYLSKAVQMEREIAQARNRAATANEGADPVTLAENQRKLAEAEAGIRKKFAEQKRPDSNPFAEEQGKSYAKYIEDFNKAAVDAQIKTEGLTKSQGNLVKMLMDPVFQSMPETWKEVGLQAAYSAIAVEQNVSATEAAAKAQADYMEKLGSAGAKEVASLQQRVDKQAQHNAEIGKTAEQIEAIRRVAEIAATDELEGQEKAIAALLDKEEALVDYAETQYTVSEDAKAIYEIELKSLREQIKLRKQLAKGYSEGEQKEAAATAAKEAAAEWKRGWEETDRLARDVFTTWATDGSNAAKKIGDTLKKALLSAVYEATLKPLVMQVYTSIAGNGIAGSALQAASGIGSAGSGIGALSGIASAVGNFSSTAGAVANGVYLGAGELGSLGLGEALSTGLGAVIEGSFASGFATLAGALGPAVLGATLLSSLMAYKVESKGNGLTATVGGASGLPSGSVGMYNEFEQTGGLFGGGTTINRDWSVADQGVATYITQNVQAITASNRAYADALGLSSEAIDSFTKNIEVSLTGLDAAGQKAAIDAALSTFAAEQAAATYGDALASVARDGETTAQTLQRLGTDLTGANAVLDSLGLELYDVSAAGASAASSMLQASGGLQNFQAQLTATYAQLSSAQQDLADANRSAYDLAAEAESQASGFGAGVGSSSGGGSSGGDNGLSEAIEYLTATQTNIRQWLDRLGSTDEGGQSVEAQRTNAWAALQAQMVLAKGGDRAALDGITGYADSYIGTINQTSATSEEARLAIGRVRGQIAALPGQVSAEQFIVNAINANGGGGGSVATAVRALNNSLGSKLTAELTVSARSEIVKLIEFVADTDKLSPDLKRLALASTDIMTKTVSFITGSRLTEENKQLALGTSSLLTKTINYTLGLDIPDEYKRLALKASDSINRTISFTARNVLDPEQAELVLMADNSIVKTIEVAADFLDANALTIAYAQSEIIRKTIEASGGVLTADQEMLLNNITAYNKQVNLIVNLDEAALNAAENFLQTRFNTLDIQTVITANNGMEVLRDFVKSQLASGPEGFAVANVYQASRQYGFTQGDIANAMGVSLSEVQSIFQKYGIPAFAAGGFHAGGLALVGERGPELVNFAQPAQIYTADQTANLMRGGQSQEVLVDEIRALRSDNQAQARALVQMQQRMNKLLERWDGTGMPEVRVVA